MTTGNAVFLAVAVLLPLLPAYLLYRLLPSEADLEGPWQGLKIKVGGAFGGYFLLVITILAYSSLLPQFDVWTVRGQMSFEDGPRTLDDRSVRFTVRPPGVSVHPNGEFRLTLFSQPDPSGFAALPLLIVEHPGYHPIGVDLATHGTRSALRRRVDLGDPLTFRPLPVLEEDRER